MSHILCSPGHYNGGDGDHTPGASSSSTPLPSTLHEVFLSFRGETRRQFTDHLYNKLDNAGISVFRDKEGLTVGERNWPELLKAIEASKISILIISPDYDSSEWCLDELVHILKCKKTYGQVVIPIFYHVKPSDLRKKFDGSEEESQVSKKRRYDYEGRHVQEWKDALEEVSYMTGLESEKIADGYEGELVKIVVAKVLKALKKHTLDVSDDLVGVGYHAEVIMNMVNVEGSSDVRAILIHGMGGIGKTTLAKVVYNQLSHHFDCCSFLANVRETSSRFNGKEGLQKQLISDILGQKESISSVDDGVKIIRDRFKCKKVLILLDDVDHRDQMNALARKWDWFGGGSILIITSRINDILKEWEGSFSYELNGLNDDDSFQLFCKHAFKRCHSIPNEFYTIAKEIVSTTGGLPLAIEVIGCLLHGEVQDIWKEKLKKLKEIPDDEVQSKLKISFDALNHGEQQIFLDIACFPDLNCEGYAIYMWDSCGFYPKLGINKLISMSLIKTGDSKELIIHDQLRDLGREIVRQENRDNPGKRSRLWNTEEAFEVLESEQGTQEVQILDLTNYSYRRTCTSKQFEGMRGLRHLRMDGVNLEGDFRKLFQSLRWLNWTHGGLDFMGSNFIPKKLVVLQFVFLNITVEWMGWNQMKRLKVLDLFCCYQFTTTPDFSAFQELEVLLLRACSELRKIHPSIGKLSKSLKVLDVSECPHLEELPIEVGKMEELRELILDSTAIREIPIEKGFMTKLETLSANNCSKLENIPDTVGSLVKLQRLMLGGCASLREIPKSIEELKLLTELDLVYPVATQLPNSIGGLYNLERLESNTRSLPRKVQKLYDLQAQDISLRCAVESVPEHEYLQFKDDCGRWNRALNFKNLNQLRTLRISISSCSIDYDRSNILQGDLLQELPSSLVELSLKHCYNLQTLLNFSNFKNLSSLHIEHCPELMEIDGLDGAESLERTEIVRCNKLSKLSCMGISLTYLWLEYLDSLVNLDLSTAKKLKNLRVIGCRNIEEIQGLDKAEGIKSMTIDGCSSLVGIGDLCCLKMLLEVRLRDCKKLLEIQGMGASVTYLEFEDLDSLVRLPDLSTVKKLKNLRISGCRNIEEIQGLDKAEGIDSMQIVGCSSLIRIGDLCCLKMLSEVRLRDCKKLLEIQGMGASVTDLEFEDLDSLVRLPDLSTAKKLKNLRISGCRNIEEIQGLDKAEGIKNMTINGCSSLVRIGDLCCLKMLTTLVLRSCKKLLEIQGMGASVTYLEFEDLDSLVRLPDLSTAKKLKDLRISGCRNIEEIQGLDTAEGIKIMIISRCSSLVRINDLCCLKMLFDVRLQDCKKLSEIQRMGASATYLRFENLDSLVRLPDLSTAKKLKHLIIIGCRNIEEIQGLDKAEGIESMTIVGCSSLVRIGNLCCLKMLSEVRLQDCKKLSEIQGMGASVTNLVFEDLDSLVRLPDLSTAKKLKNLSIIGCRNIAEIQGLDRAEGVEGLTIVGCSSLERIGSLSNLKTLTYLTLCNCKKLNDVQVIEKLTTLMTLSFSGCDPEIKFPDLSMLKNLKYLIIEEERIVEIPGLQELNSLEILDISRCKPLQVCRSFTTQET